MELKGSTLGERLRLGREQRDMTSADVAKELRLTINLVEHMEANEFDKGPGTMFMKGYIRSYAKLVGLPTQEVTTLIELAGLAEDTEETITPDPAAKPYSTLRLLKVMVYFAVVITLLIVAKHWHQTPANKPTPKQNIVKTAQQEDRAIVKAQLEPVQAGPSEAAMSAALPEPTL